MFYTIHGILQEAVKKDPDKIAVFHNNESISYSDLFKSALALGYYLKNKSGNKGDRVGIFLNKSISQVISILGTLFADCVFVPINTNLSEEQVEYISNDCKIKYLI